MRFSELLLNYKKMWKAIETEIRNDLIPAICNTKSYTANIYYKSQYSVVINNGHDSTLWIPWSDDFGSCSVNTFSLICIFFDEKTCSEHTLLKAFRPLLWISYKLLWVPFVCICFLFWNSHSILSLVWFCTWSLQNWTIKGWNNRTIIPLYNVKDCQISELEMTEMKPTLITIPLKSFLLLSPLPPSSSFSAAAPCRNFSKLRASKKMQKYHYMYARDVAVIKMAARVVSVHTAMPYARTADGYLNPGTHCGILNEFYNNYHSQILAAIIIIKWLIFLSKHQAVACC